MKNKTGLIIPAMLILAAAAVFLYGVSGTGKADGPGPGIEGGTENMNVRHITMEEAKQIFEADRDGSYIILDVRRADEFAAGHIPGAINIANETIGAAAPAELPDFD